MTNGTLEQEYKELYNAEIARKDELDQAIDRPVAIVSAYCGVIYFSIAGLKLPFNFLNWSQGGLVAIAIVFVVVAIWYLVKAGYGHTYGYVPTPKQLVQYKQTLLDHYAKYPPTSEIDFDKEVLAHIYSSYVEGAHQNAEINALRSSLLHRVKVALIWALPFVGLLALTKAISDLLRGIQ
jgi:hypothetical protein